ncbi:helix-turn-helix domain-containing protein [Kitasatospora viridis]|uniref:Helix-turn-helix protein n=1 Tax=Kitasatospora viridis TaxID=281105 RepID=A0A561SE01_9ACTN|nr:helix-turn-helix transcriptional regulator [Kitasatospora viridis]TWF73087.1 helix-turn-helix protein [Kitasatospora viridis]
MALRSTVSERQRRLGAELRTAREKARVKLREAGELIDLSTPHLSHIEAGRTAISPDRVRTLMTAYGCKDEAYIAGLLALESPNVADWWSSYQKRMPQHSLDIAEMDASARRIITYETFHIPGLLQTPDYGRAVFRHTYNPLKDQETGLAFRLARQAVLEMPDAPECHFVIHEAALLARFAGKDVSRRQLVHLIEMAERPNITIQIMPFTVQGYSPYAAPFFICEPAERRLATVGIDHPDRAEFLTGPEEIDSYEATFDQLAKLSLPPISMMSLRERPERDSWGLIQHVMYQL